MYIFLKKKPPIESFLLTCPKWLPSKVQNYSDQSSEKAVKLSDLGLNLVLTQIDLKKIHDGLPFRGEVG